MMIFSPADVVYRGLVIYTESTLYGTVQVNGSVTLTYPGETFFRVTLTACTNSLIYSLFDTDLAFFKGD